jgi:hypothetical protein
MLSFRLRDVGRDEFSMDARIKRAHGDRRKGSGPSR